MRGWSPQALRAAGVCGVGAGHAKNLQRCQGKTVPSSSAGGRSVPVPHAVGWSRSGSVNFMRCFSGGSLERELAPWTQPGVHLGWFPWLAGFLRHYGRPLACWRYRGWCGESPTAAQRAAQGAAHQGRRQASARLYLKLPKPVKGLNPLAEQCTGPRGPRAGGWPSLSRCIRHDFL